MGNWLSFPKIGECREVLGGGPASPLKL